MLLPPDNQRVKDVIDFYCNGNELLFSREIGISQPRINRLFKIDSRSNKYPAPSYEIVQAIINKFVEINPRWLLTGQGDPNFGNNNCKVNCKDDCKVNPDFPLDLRKTKSTTLKKQEILLPNNGKTNSTNIIELPVITCADSDLVSIPLVDISVAAGSGFYNSDLLNEIDCIRMPHSMLKGNQLRLCIRIKGESMVPTLQDGSYLIIRLLDRSEWQYVHDGHIYVLSDTTGRAFVKRVKNSFQEHGFIVCRSDNLDLVNYPDFNLRENELNTIWHVEWYISAKMPNIHTTFYNKVSDLENKYDDLQRNFTEELRLIRSEIRALLKK